MKNIELNYYTSKENWKELMEELKAVDGITISYFPEVDANGLFTDFEYLVIEYNNQFFSLNSSLMRGFEVTPFHKVSPYEKIQAGYSKGVNTSIELLEYIKSYNYTKPLKDCSNQRIYLIELYSISGGKTSLLRLKEASGEREKDIFNNLDKIEMVQHDKDYNVLRFWHKDGEHTFDYECNSKRITG